MITPAALLTRLRERRPFLDHLVRTYGRYQADTGDRLAAAVTFYWFLSLFPILLVAIAILGFALGDGASTTVTHGLRGYLPPAVAKTVGDVIQNSKGKAGILGLIGTLLSGLGWIDGLREAIRTIWHQNVTAGNFITRKILDIGVLLGLFAVIAASVLVSGAATVSQDAVISFLGQTSTPGVALLTRVLGFVIGGGVDTLVFLYLFSRLARVRSPLRRLLKGALFGAVGFELVKFFGAIYVARTTSKGEATYGTFAVVVGLLLFLNLVTRVILLAAAFTVTAPYDSDVAPSGTADSEQARKAGIPEEFADNDPDEPPLLMKDGAPSPLRAAVQGRTPPQDEPEGREAVAAGVSQPLASSEGPEQAAGRSGGAATGGGSSAGAVAEAAATEAVAPTERSWSRRPVALPQLAQRLAPAPSGPVGELPGAAHVQLAARALSTVFGAAMVAVLVHALRTVRRVLAR